MEKHKAISVSDYDYPLPEHRVAKHPLPQRDSSKLLIYKDNIISSSTFSSIVDLVQPNDLMVFNNTKVIQARIRFRKPTGAPIEVFLLNPVRPSDYQEAFGSRGRVDWLCIVGNIKRWRGDALEMPLGVMGSNLYATLLERTPDGAVVRFQWDNPDLCFASVVEACGEMPIPPYLNRPTEQDDRLRYQTVYAQPEGSVAAPTAGLHFTRELLDTVAQRGTQLAEVTLHVGAGTFQPVKGETIGDHPMHTESCFVTHEAIDKILNCKGHVVSIGTTSLRTLESLYWLGAKLLSGQSLGPTPHVAQWDGFSGLGQYPVADSLSALKSYILSSGKGHIEANTQLIIVPGYQFRVVNSLVTNFHQPRSTLLLLIAAFIGEDWRRVYDYALANDFRFLSYGDSSFLVSNWVKFSEGFPG